MTNIDPKYASDYLSKYLASTAISKEGTGPWIELIGKAGGQAELTKLFSQVVGGAFDASATTRAIVALDGAQRLRNQTATGDLNAISKLIESDDDSIRTSAIRLIGTWRLHDQVDALTGIAKNAKSDGNRDAAIAALRDIGDPSIVSLTKLSSDATLATSKIAVLALASLGPERAAIAFYVTLARIENESEADRIILGDLKDGWKPLWSRVDGSVYKEQLDALTTMPQNTSLVNVYLRSGFMLANDGRVTFRIDGIAKVALWIDAVRVEGTSTFVSQLKSGKHTVLVQLDARSFPTKLRLESRDVAFLTE